jgi:hypothetical protein
LTGPSLAAKWANSKEMNPKSARKAEEMGLIFFLPQFRILWHVV